MEITDIELIAKSTRGDDRSQRELYMRYRVRWYMLSLRYGRNKEEADDILQEGLVNIFNDLHQFDHSRGKFTTWSCRVLVNAALRYLKKNAWNANFSDITEVINAWLNDLDDNQLVNLSYTTNYLDNSTKEFEPDAKISLYDGEETVDLMYSDKGNYLLPSDWKGIVGKTYTLEVMLLSSVYTATSTIRTMPELLNVYYEEQEHDEDEEIHPDSIFYDIFFSFKDSDGEGDGYYGIDYNIETEYGDTMTNGDFIDDEFIDGEFFEDISLTGQDHMEEDTVALEVYSIGRDASRYLQDIIDEVFRGGIFDPAPVNVRSNFSNGALGYFIASAKRKEIIVIE